MSPTPLTIEKYLASLPEDRRTAIQAVRAVILKNMDKDYEEGIQYGCIGYFVPHRIFPAGYHCDPKQPLPLGALASRKGYMTVMFMSIYGGGELADWFRKEWAKTGKKLDMGAACIRFRKLDDLPLDVIGELVRRVPAKKYIEFYQASLGAYHKAKPAKAKKRAAR
ncbi:MAG: hypothetical protein FD180_3353 [Planctomycetota bacterium]|nr:MAG: hypothetical protein FD180_3353 [Planctomycetota bacterium]